MIEKTDLIAMAQTCQMAHYKLTQHRRLLMQISREYADTRDLEIDLWKVYEALVKEAGERGIKK